MKQKSKLMARFEGITQAVSRFPLTTAVLIVAALINAAAIWENKDYSKYLLTLAVGAVLGVVAQAIYERFFSDEKIRLTLMGLALALTVGYYFIILPAPTISEEIGTRTVVALFALFIAFIWVPVIKSRITFNESFMAAFKGFFISLFFAGVIMGGVSLIIATVDQLLFEVESDSFAHSANLIFILFAPLYFLSLIPLYPGVGKNKAGEAKAAKAQDEIDKASSCPKFLEILISYIIIPLIGVFTVVLVLYIALNIAGEFWTNNLLEPMIVTYSITVILVYVLASLLANKFAMFFRTVFPKVLVPIVLFQLASSFINIFDTGITHPRYFVLLFGIYAVLSGVILSFVPVRKNGIIAAALVAFALFSIIPPVDAFTISRINQKSMLESTLEKNNMFTAGGVQPNSEISARDKEVIVQTMRYLDRMGYTKELKWLPSDFSFYRDFSNTFGFEEYTGSPQMEQFLYLSLDQDEAIDIAGYDYMVYSSVYMQRQNGADNILQVTKEAMTYTLSRELTSDDCILKIRDINNISLIEFSSKEIMESFGDLTNDKTSISVAEATFNKENDRAKISVIIQNTQLTKTSTVLDFRADVYILFAIK